jgi:hypothetical protein
MHARTEELLRYLDTQRAVLRAAVENVPSERREVPPAAGCWSVAEILEHLAQTETLLAGLFARRLAEAKAQGLAAETETSPILPALDLERIVDRSEKIVSPMNHPGTGLDSEAAWAALETAGETFRRAFLAGDGLAWSALQHPHPAFGMLNFYCWTAFVGAHEARHAKQIEEIASAIVNTTARQL